MTGMHIKNQTQDRSKASLAYNHRAGPSSAFWLDFGYAQCCGKILSLGYIWKKNVILLFLKQLNL